MLLLVASALGIAFGYWLGITKRGFVVLGSLSLCTSILQFGLLFITTDRTQMTLLPLVIGTIMVAGVVIGAFMRTALHASTAA